jgi:ELWxxDGT repeat protein
MNRPRHRVHPFAFAGFAAAAAFSTSLAAQGTPYLVADLTTSPLAPAPVLQVDAGAVAGNFAIAFRTTYTEIEVWRTDGTTAGTSLLRSVPAAPLPIGAAPLVARNGLVFFCGPSDDGRDMLWVSDGTSTGTFAIGGAGRTPRSLVVDTTLTTTRVWFSASDAANGRELWRSDGTAAGTVRVTQLRAGAGDGMPPRDRVIAPLPSGVFIAGDNGTSGEELFRIVGGFHVLYANLASGSASSEPRDFVWSGDYLMFSAAGAGGREPYCLAQNVLQTIDVRPGPSSSMGTPNNLVVYQPTAAQPFFYFGANGNTGNGFELWRYNPFSQGLTEIDVVPGSTGSSAVPLFVLGSRIVCARPGSASSSNLFTVNGGGTTVTPLMNGTSYPFVSSSSPAQMLIPASSGANAGLWRSNGTVAGTTLIDPVGDASPGTLLPAGAGCVLEDGRRIGTTGSPSPMSLPIPPLNAGSALGEVTSIGGGVVLFTKDGAAWRSDGTAAGTVALLPGPNPPLLWSIGPRFQNRHWFVVRTIVTTSTSLFALYSTDGTPAGTVHVSDLATTIPFDFPFSAADYAIVGSRLLVRVPSHLFSTDGASVQLLATGVGVPCVLGDYALFGASNGSGLGHELWRTDGTVAGTTLVKDIQPGTGGGVVSRVMPLGATTALLVGDSGSGEQIWRTNGTLLTTNVVSAFGAYPYIELLASTGTGRVLFIARSPNDSRDLWSTNGTTAGTVMLVDDPGYTPELLGKCNGAWLFAHAGPGLLGGRLYKTNGTVATTSFVTTLPAGTIGSTEETALLDTYLPLAQDARLFTVGNRLFRSDGTAGGTYALGPAPAVQWDAYSARPLAPPGADIAVFAGHDTSGFELWRSDGSLANTTLHAELNPGPASSAPRDFAHSGGLVFFTTDDGQHGRELWAMPAMPTVIPYGAACPGTGGRTPELVATSPPRLGGTFATELGEGLVSSIAVRSLGFTELAVPVGGSCSVLNEGLVLDAFVLDALGVGAPPPTGIPLTTSLAGVSLFAQGAVLDPAGAFASLLAMTGGLQAIVGP